MNMTCREFIEQLAQDWNVTQKIAPWEREQAANRLFDFVSKKHEVRKTQTCAACNGAGFIEVREMGGITNCDDCNGDGKVLSIDDEMQIEPAAQHRLQSDKSGLDTAPEVSPSK